MHMGWEIRFNNEGVVECADEFISVPRIGVR
jgi:hypothetical protein